MTMKRIVILPVALAALLTGGCWQLNLAWRSTTVQTYARDRDGAITASNGVKGGADLDADGLLRDDKTVLPVVRLRHQRSRQHRHSRNQDSPHVCSPCHGFATVAVPVYVSPTAV